MTFHFGKKFWSYTAREVGGLGAASQNARRYANQSTLHLGSKPSRTRCKEKDMMLINNERIIGNIKVNN